MLTFPASSSRNLTVLLLVSSYAFGVNGQAFASCSESQFPWAFNDLGQSPCYVAAQLAGACTGQPANITSLSQGETYSNTDPKQMCQCNAVMYCLMSACAICQGGQAGSWNDWIAGCGADYDGFPAAVPPGTDIPRWAWQNMSPKGVFNATLAQSDAGSIFCYRSSMHRELANACYQL
ncbi:hypothetical protein SISSUDRAFT_128098 [Sistotremastrum suecicum HHB10207 ss-3]|uniref:Secreted protein n=1 Tax=Sistotremastrum suecicum HHB10207 ss-3 TaxID=1314776 RepID=A0A166AYJ6_9AGAM|nr:hypothetical protein SISSUDRAFT_128098 [Sistotremastrum suecicum HHB10207 ss-3]